MVNEMSISEYMKRKVTDQEGVLVDLRDSGTYWFGSIPGAVNIPNEEIRQLYQLPRDKNIYVYCQVGELSGEIAALLDDAGYTVFNLTGGYREYVRFLGYSLQ